MAGRRVGRQLMVALLVTSLAAPAVAGGAPTSQPEVDNTVTHIDVAADGSATWTVSVRTRLETDQQVEEFRAFQRRFRNNRTQYVATFRDRIQPVVVRAANETDREMQASNFAAATSIQELPRRWGVVTYEFTWTRFATTAGDVVSAGDVFQGGFYLAQGDSLVISPPEGYDVASVTPEPDARENESVRWTGPLDFADERPAVRYAQTQSATAGQPTTATTMHPTTATTMHPTTATTTDGGDGIPWLPLAAVGLLAVLAVAGFVYRTRRGEPGEASHTAERVTGDVPVTNEERVQELLAANDRRMEQSAVVDELNWSPSKTSRVVASMVEDGSVEKLRVGRKNILELVED